MDVFGFCIQSPSLHSILKSGCEIGFTLFSYACLIHKWVNKQFHYQNTIVGLPIQVYGLPKNAKPIIKQGK